MLLGMIIGLLLGIVIALAVALWLNRLSNPFVDKAKPIEPLAKIGPAQPPKADEKGTPGEARRRQGEDGPPALRVLHDAPRREGGDGQGGEGRRRQAEGARQGRAPAPRPSQPKPYSGETYWLQAGAFSDEKEADNLKAKIAFTGLEASVKAVDVPGKGTLHRVRLGPYQSLDDANRIKAALSQNGVGATIIRTDEAKNR